MFDITDLGARHAISSVSDLFSSFESSPEAPMPSPNAATKLPTEKASATIDLGQKLSKKKSQEFTAKVARWNSSGGGIVHEQSQNEIVVVEESVTPANVIDVTPAIVEVIPKTVAQSKSNNDKAPVEVVEVLAVSMKPKSPADGDADKLASSRRASREVDLGRKAWVRRKSKPPPPAPEPEPEPDVKHAGTPKKRVVSDGHWRRDRQAKPETPDRDITPKPTIIRNSVASVGIKVPPSVQNFVEELETRPPRPRPAARTRSPSRSKSREREGTPDYQSSGLKVYVKRRRTSRPSPQETPSAEATPPRSLSPALATPTRPSTAPRLRRSKPMSPEETDRPASASARIPRKALNSAEPDSRRESPKEDHRKVSSKLEPKPSAPPPVSGPPRVFGTRIEGWLASTSDPFTEPAVVSEGPPVPRHKTRRDIEDKENTDLRQSDTEKYKEPHSQSRRRSSRPSLEPIEGQRSSSFRDTRRHSSREDRESSPTTPTLKRSGARRVATSPVKDRASRENTPQHDDFANRESNPSRRSSNAKRIESHGSAMARRIPTKGNELHTINSVETFNSLADSDRQTFIPDGSVLSRASDGDDRHRPGSLKRRLTKHSDLMSVLSMQRSESKRVRTKTSNRSRRVSENVNLGDVMNEVTTAELKYQRELRTLVDGVIPVLLQSVLNDTGKSSAAGMLKGSPQTNHAATKPIVEMGVALERLKTTHKRIPMHNTDDLLEWAQSASKVYADYLQVWRLGFQDIVVNLAPAEGAEKQGAARWGDDLPRNDNGDLTSGDGERVDVAYLLKRPLVRLKHLAKTFETTDQINPSRNANNMAMEYQRLVNEARKRAGEERARLEDEAASSIDPTRARDCRTLAPISGVQIDSTRSVRARDFFDLDLRHSSGQQLNCKIETIMRDDAPGRGDAGDVLFCEVSPTGRWLLFPPIHSTMISARKGKGEGEIIVMIRGHLQAGGREWREIMALQAEDEEAIDEWLGIFPQTPVPPRLAAKSSFDLSRNPVMSGALPEPVPPGVGRMPSLREVEVPIGERIAITTNTWDASEVNSNAGDGPNTSLLRKRAARYKSRPSSPSDERDSRAFSEEPLIERPRTVRERPRSEYIAPREVRPSTGRTRTTSSWDSETASSMSKKDYSVWLPSTRRTFDESSPDEDDKPIPKRPSMHRRTSSVPSMDTPTVPKLRKPSEPITPKRKTSSQQHQHETPITSTSPAIGPHTAPSKLQKRKSTPPKERESERAPPPPAHSRTTSLGLRSNVLPSFTPAFLRRNRRPSSPLKHEYEPSTATSSSDSEVSGIDDVDSYTSESAAEDLPEDQISTIGELKSFPTFGGYKSMAQKSPPETIFSPSDPSLAPSQSASQAPYRTVPPPEVKAAESVACIFVWSDHGSWDTLHPEECCIVVTPGLIEAFDIAQAHAAPAVDADQAQQSPSTRGVKPLVALELTPLVPLRRGTALDISIRSPPTQNSLFRTGNNIMFRSRNVEECEALYHMINRARIDNPTYIALQRARGPQAQSNWGEAMDRRNAARTSSGSSWWNLGSRKSSTYRSNSSTRPRSVAATESSVATMNTAFSALRRFSGSNRFFNITKSTITSRQGSRSTYSDSLDSGMVSPVTIDPSLGTPLGLTNMKIRLYIRETASKWRDMGSARLTILIPPRPDPSVPANPATTGKEKRVMIYGKTKGETLLDATLGESCFERIARTGIAVSVWQENAGGVVGAVGGVLASKSSVYMVQMKTEREAAYAFGLVGKLRY